MDLAETALTVSRIKLSDYIKATSKYEYYSIGTALLSVPTGIVAVFSVLLFFVKKDFSSMFSIPWTNYGLVAFGLLALISCITLCWIKMHKYEKQMIKLKSGYLAQNKGTIDRLTRIQMANYSGGTYANYGDVTTEKVRLSVAQQLFSNHLEIYEGLSCITS